MSAASHIDLLPRESATGQIATCLRARTHIVVGSTSATDWEPWLAGDFRLFFDGGGPVLSLTGERSEAAKLVTATGMIAREFGVVATIPKTETAAIASTVERPGLALGNRDLIVTERDGGRVWPVLLVEALAIDHPESAQAIWDSWEAEQ